MQVKFADQIYFGALLHKLRPIATHLLFESLLDYCWLDISLSEIRITMQQFSYKKIAEI